VALKDVTKAVGEQAEAVAKDEPQSAAGYLLGATAVVAGVFTTLHITGNLFSRMLANHPWWVGAAMVSAGLATSLTLVTLVLKTWFDRAILLIAVALVLAGTTFAVVAALLVSADAGKPVVAITKFAERELEATVKVLNVKTAGGKDEIASWAIAATETGSFERTLDVQIPEGIEAVCVEASMLKMPNATSSDSARRRCRG